MMYITVVVGYRAIFATRGDAVESGMLDKVIRAAAPDGIQVFCELDPQERYHYLVGRPLSVEQDMADGDMLSVALPKRVKGRIKSNWKALSRALSGKVKPAPGLQVHVLARE